MSEKELELEKRIKELEKLVLSLNAAFIALSENYKRFLFVFGEIAKKEGWTDV
jgi:hypothetical protein